MGDELRSKSGRTVTAGDLLAEFEVRHVTLRVENGPQKGRTWSSDGARSCSIGSHASCELMLDDPTVSRFHCELRIDGRRARIRDTGSHNGTYVDGVQLVEGYVRNGARVRLGRSVVRVEVRDDTSRAEVSERDSFGAMLGTSPAMRRTFPLFERAAGSDASVILEGETGVGKSLAARCIHDQGARAKGPFVAVNCGAIPATLLESELFGHEKGAFTSADARRIGAFEEAHGGTLFLDEIGELPIDLQPKLLGALESREIRRLGGSKAIPVDVRLIVATNRSLRAEVNANRFRSDLYYRLAVLSIEQPPLRERAADIPLLARSILRGLGAKDAQIASLCSDEFFEQLARAPWPGNIRELRNYLERCLVFNEALPVDVPLSGDGGDGSGDAAERDEYLSLPYADARDRALRQFERRYLQRLIDDHDKAVDAAASAGIDRTYFYRLLRRHGMTF